MSLAIGDHSSTSANLAKLAELSRASRNSAELSRIRPNFPELSRIRPNFPKLSRIRPNFPEFGRTFPNFPEFGRTFPNFPEFGRIRESSGKFGRGFFWRSRTLLRTLLRGSARLFARFSKGVHAYFFQIPELSRIRPNFPELSRIRPNFPELSRIRPNFPELSRIRPNLAELPRSWQFCANPSVCHGFSRNKERLARIIYDMIYKYLIPFLQTWLILGALYSIFPDAPIALVSTFFWSNGTSKTALK